MDDLISRQAAIDAIEEYADRLQIVDWKENPGVPYKAYALNWCINTIRDLPSVQPERKKGKWIDKGWNGDWQYQTDGRGRCWHEWQCSECNDITKGAKWDFCPNCGADMRGEKNG